jgi:hypothetical protein
VAALERDVKKKNENRISDRRIRQLAQLSCGRIGGDRLAE